VATGNGTIVKEMHCFSAIPSAAGKRYSPLGFAGGKGIAKGSRGGGAILVTRDSLEAMGGRRTKKRWYQRVCGGEGVAETEFIREMEEREREREGGGGTVRQWIH